MKVLFFKNESGDDSYAICEVDRDLTEKEIFKIVSENIGDDFFPAEDLEDLEDLQYGEELQDGYIYGNYWIEDFSDLQKASKLLNNEKNI